MIKRLMYFALFTVAIVAIVVAFYTLVWTLITVVGPVGIAALATFFIIGIFAWVLSGMMV